MDNHRACNIKLNFVKLKNYLGKAAMDKITSVNGFKEIVSSMAKTAQKNAPARKPTDRMPFESDKVIIHGGLKKTASSDAEQKEKIKSELISLEEINVPIEVIACPLGDPAFLGCIAKTIRNQKGFKAEGKIKQGNVSYNVWLSLRENNNREGMDKDYLISSKLKEDSAIGINYTMTGKVGAIELKLDFYSSGLTLYVKGNVGINKVALQNKYSLFTGRLDTTGNIGGVEVELMSYEGEPFTASGRVGSELLESTATSVQDGKVVKGKLGKTPINGRTYEENNNVIGSKMTAGDLETEYTVKVL